MGLPRALRNVFSHYACLAAFGAIKNANIREKPKEFTERLRWKLMDTVVRGGIVLPSSSGRAADKFLKLLRAVDAEAQHGFGFEGKFLRPGATVTTAELHPSHEYPSTPLLLEHTRARATGIKGHRRCLSLYILWQYDHHSNEWVELGRAAAASWEWAVELRPLALRALRGGGAELVPAKPDLPAIATRIAHAIGAELEGLAPPERFRVIAIIHDEFALLLSA